MPNISSFLETLNRWLSGEPAIAAVLLVGSHARGTAREDSDVDLVLITKTPQAYLDRDDWLTMFGKVKQSVVEDWGLLKSKRVFYEGGLEVEFGLTVPQWAAINPIDAGTHRVVTDGAQILMDRDGILATLLNAISG